MLVFSDRQRSGSRFEIANAEVRQRTGAERQQAQSAYERLNLAVDTSNQFFTFSTIDI